MTWPFACDKRRNVISLQGQNEEVPCSIGSSMLRDTQRANPFSDTVPCRRVLHVINGEHYAGAERVQDVLASTLPEFGYEVGFACVKPGAFPKQRKAIDVPLFETRMRSKFDLTSIKSLAQVAKIGGYDLIHAHTTRSLLFGSLAARLAQKPLVYHVHSPTIHDSTRFFTNRVNAIVERVGLWNARKLICVSHSLGEHMRAQGYRSSLIRVVPNGVPGHGPLFDREPPAGTPWTVGTVALFRPRKGIEVLLQALALVRQRQMAVQLRAVGKFETPEYEAKIKALVQELRLDDCIEWVGFSSDVATEMRKMDLMVLPSLFGEGLPMVVIEAMAAGVPVIGTRVQGVPEVLVEGHGLLAEPNSAQSLAECLERFDSGGVDWARMREQAWLRHANEFSDQSMTRGVASVYDDVLGVATPTQAHTGAVATLEA